MVYLHGGAAPSCAYSRLVAIHLCATLITMLPRTILSSLLLLLLALYVLVNFGSPAEARTPNPLLPPPMASPARFAPLSPLPTMAATAEAVTVTSTITVTADAILTPSATPISNASVLTATAPVSAPEESADLTASPTTASFILPTVTPTRLPPMVVLLPTPTPLPTRAATSIAAPPGTATEVITASAPVTDIAPVASTVLVTTPVGDLPSPFMTVTMPLPASYETQGSFASQTVYTDSTIVQQQGSFTIRQSASLNAYGVNQHYTLRTQRAAGNMDEINVYLVDQYIAVNYTGGDWMLVRRDQGSNIVRAIQPLTDLALLFPRIISQAELVNRETVAGIPSLRYRIDDPAGQGARLIQPLLALTGEIRSLKLEVWIAVPGGYVVAYNFQVELAGARVLDPEGNEVRADQAVTWTYQMVADGAPQPIAWPADAPTPDAFPVPGFAAGTFPVPPNTELLSLVGGVPDLISAASLVEVDSFYRTELFTMGWTVEGEGGLLRVSKDGTTFQLLITEDAAANATRITILPNE